MQHRLMVQCHKGKNVGTRDTGLFQFYLPNATTSEGGIITTDDEELAKRARMFKLYGSLYKVYS